MSEYTTQQIKVPSNPSGNADDTNGGWAPLWGHHTSKTVFDGTYFYVISTGMEGLSNPYNFRIYRIDTRQKGPAIASISYKHGEVYQTPTMIIDKYNRIHVFFIQTDGLPPSSTERIIKHYRSTVKSYELTNSEISTINDEWELITSVEDVSNMHGYISAAYDPSINTVYLAYNNYNADLKIARFYDQSSWSEFYTVKAATSSHIAGQKYRALYCHILPYGTNSVELFWIRSFNLSNYDKVIYAKYDFSTLSLENEKTILDRSPGGDSDPLLVSNPYIFMDKNYVTHLLYWSQETNSTYYMNRYEDDTWTDPIKVDENREFRQYGVMTEEYYPHRLHIFLTSALSGAPENGVAHYFSEDRGKTWNYDQDFIPPRATEIRDDYPDLIHTFNNRDGALNQTYNNFFIYNGIYESENSDSQPTKRVILEILQYKEPDQQYEKSYDIQEIIVNILNNHWHSRFGKLPIPIIKMMDDPDRERFDIEDWSSNENIENKDLMFIHSESSYDEEPIGNIAIFRNISVGIELEIFTATSREKLLSLVDELRRIIYQNQFNFKELNGFHKLQWNNFTQSVREGKKRIWHGSIELELHATGVPIPQIGVQPNIYKI